MPPSEYPASDHPEVPAPRLGWCFQCKRLLIGLFTAKPSREPHTDSGPKEKVTVDAEKPKSDAPKPLRPEQRRTQESIRDFVARSLALILEVIRNDENPDDIAMQEFLERCEERIEPEEFDTLRRFMLEMESKGVLSIGELLHLCQRLFKNNTEMLEEDTNLRRNLGQLSIRFPLHIDDTFRPDKSVSDESEN